ncbi:MAG: YdeI/OmpD-associated family protein [Brevinema sp.]
MHTFTPHSRQEWREWLEKHSQKETSIYLVYHKKNTGIPSLTWSEAVKEALCFGWIDSTKKRIDDNTYQQLFTPRNPKSTWSKINKEYIEELETQGLMTDYGREKVQIAKKNGSWTALDDCYNMVIPEDLQNMLSPVLLKNFHSLSDSKKTEILMQLHHKKRPDTRQKFITDLIKIYFSK